jgi:poly(3-hydroxybutyrate) depolymerase
MRRKGMTRGGGCRGARFVGSLVAGALLVGAAPGCGSSTESSSGATAHKPAADAGGPFDAGLRFTCTPVTAGDAGGGEGGAGLGPPSVGSVSVNGASARSYYVDLPANTSGPMALMFSWHGFNQEPLDFRNQLAFDPDGASMPIVVVTPTDTGLFLPDGLDWFILGTSANTDFPYFQGMLSCLESQYDIDTTRVYSFGFSAGAVFTDLLADQWPHLFAATVSESGCWFSDPKEVAAIVAGLGSSVTWDWPALNPADRGNVLMTHGGPTDFATIISIEDADQAALPYLLENERTVVDCAHDAGHAIDPDVKNSMIYEYLLAHRLGQPSPFAGGMPLFPDFPSSCTLNLPH